MCRLCRVTENMKEHVDDLEDIMERPKIELVYSASNSNANEDRFVKKGISN